MTWTPNRRMGAVAVAIVALDQFTKWVVLNYLNYAHEKIIIDGFFKFVHWGNTGAAWSMFHGNNALLAIISLVALMLLFLNRRHFEAHTFAGQIALGLMFGGITGNLIDRLWREHVIDFIYFYVYRRSGGESGFPAFNVADSAICIGVGLLFIMSWKNDEARASAGTG
jgi:signal peptidase II